MRPAFTSSRQAAMFALMLVVLLSLPLVMRRSWLPPREEIYSSLPWAVGAFPYLHDQIFEEKTDIDVLFMGSSRIWWAIDTPQVQKALSAKLGREAVVRTFAWDSPGFDAFYFILRDVLAHRKVRMLVFSDSGAGGRRTAHPVAPAWFRMADDRDGLAGLSQRSAITFYSSAILGMPRSLLSLLRANMPAISSDEISWDGFDLLRNPSLELGSMQMRKRLDKPFVDYRPETTATPKDVKIYSPAAPKDFSFSLVPLLPIQSDFARKIGVLARARGVKLVYINLPESNDMRSQTIKEATFWPAIINSDLTMLGVIPATLFGGLSDEQVLSLYFNFEHFNRNGEIYYTSIITPTLIRMYENLVHP
jgi:hypothetical protein